MYKDDSPTKLSKDFCLKHNFDSVTHEQLIYLIQERIQKVKNIQNNPFTDASWAAGNNL